MPTILSTITKGLRALATALLSALEYVIKVLLDLLSACLAKLYTWDLEANIPQADVIEPELSALGGIRARLAAMDLLASRSPQGLALVGLEELDNIRNQQDEEDWEAWEAWRRVMRWCRENTSDCLLPSQDRKENDQDVQLRRKG